LAFELESSLLWQACRWSISWNSQSCHRVNLMIDEVGYQAGPGVTSRCLINAPSITESAEPRFGEVVPVHGAADVGIVLLLDVEGGRAVL
jgi:hypothetical protein